LPGGTFVPASLNHGEYSFALAEAGAHWTLYDFGRTQGRYGQALTRSRIEELTLGRAKQTVAFDVAQAYFRLLAAQATVRVEEQALHQAQAILRDTKARRGGGVAEREDVLRADLQTAQEEEKVLMARQALADAVSILNNVMGRPPTPIEVHEVHGQPAFAQPFPDSLQEALDRRPEVKVAREAVAEATFGEQAARGEMLPKVFVKGTVVRVDSPGTLNGWVTGAGFHVEQPIYAGGAHQGELRRNRAQITLASAALKSILDNISLQVSLAYHTIDTNRQRLRVGSSAVAQARENLRLTLVRYKNGTATPTDVVDAQTALTRAQTVLITAGYDYLEGLARLDYAQGGDQQRLVKQLGYTKDDSPEAEPQLPAPRALFGPVDPAPSP
jgi:outer membrane protein